MTDEQDALRALRDGDYPGAATLLEDIVSKNHYSSSVLNDAYTIALHAAGKTSELAEAAFRIGNHYETADPGLALDYYQRAIFFGLDPAGVRQACEFQARLAKPRSGPRGAIRTDRIAHVIGCFLPGHAPSLYIQLMSDALADHGVQSCVFTTEWAAGWFFNPPGRQSQPMDVKAETIVGPEQGGFLERADRVAEAIREHDIDVVFYHCGPTEQITIRVAALHPARVQINVNHATEVDADIFEGFAHLFQNGLERSRFPHRPSRWIPLISDIEDRLAVCSPASRMDFDVVGAETVSGTFGNLFKASSEEYIRTLVRILERFPKHYHLIAGSGDEEPLRQGLDAAGLLSRVRFLGYMDDVAPILNLIDVYLNTFPVSGGQSILEPMSIAKPVVVLKYAEATHFNAGAELAGIPEAVVDSEDEYVELASRLIEDPGLRDQHGAKLQRQFRENFRPSGLGPRYVDFIDEVVRQTASGSP